MRFNTHSSLEGKHALLSASKYHWINYEDEKFDAMYRAALAAQRGTEIHAFASEAIRLGIKLPVANKTLNLYINDAIGYRMSPEVILFYSYNAFGTADAVGFKNNFLRISDLKTGSARTSFHQLEVYAALFCLEYDLRPSEIEIELRIYQSNEAQIYIPELDDIVHIMSKIVTFDKRIDALKAEVLL